jgi:hypothetical protein
MENQATDSGVTKHGESEPEIVIDVVLKLNDVYTPFDWNRQNLIRWVLAILAGYIVYDICFSASSQLQSFPDANAISAVIVTLAIFIALGLVLFPYLRLRSLFRNAPGFKTPAKYMFDTQGMRFESEDAKGEYKWSVFGRIFETRKAFALAQTDYAATYIPKRCFKSPSDISVFRVLVRENFKGRWRLRRD